MGILFHFAGAATPTGTPEQQRLLASALATFAARGYDRASLKQIAAAAHVTAAMVNYYFDSKEKLFRRVVEDCFVRLHALVEQRTGAHLPFMARITGFVVGHAELALSSPEAAELLVRTAFRPSDAGDSLVPELMRRHAPLRDKAYEILAAACRPKQLLLRAPIDLARAADHLLGQVELMLIRQVQRRRFPKAEVPQLSTEEIVDLFLHGISHKHSD